MNTKIFCVTFWGTRGSCPTGHPDYMKYGCHTSCVGIEADGTQFIVDAGTGIKNLGNNAFIKNPKNINIMLSHFHFDHTMGLPFFNEMFNKDAVINIYGRPLIYNSLYELMNECFRPPFFPTEFLGKDAIADIEFKDLDESGVIQFQNSVQVEYCPIPHAGGATAFKFSKAGKIICYMSDLELGENTDTNGFDRNLIEFAQNADLLIIDAFFTGDDIIPGWGHSSWEQVINFAKKASVKKIVMYHHNIISTDNIIDACYKKHKENFENIIIAKEGLEIYI